MRDRAREVIFADARESSTTFSFDPGLPRAIPFYFDEAILRYRARTEGGSCADLES